MRLSWLTDIHAFILKDQRELIAGLAGLIHNQQPQGVLITGDIAESDSVVQFLKGLSRALDLPIYFILGNHDFYGGWINQVRCVVDQLGRLESSLKYLKNLKYLSSQIEPIRLTSEVCLIGHDGWSDGRFGDFENSKIKNDVNDYTRISDFVLLTEKEKLEKMNYLGDESALHLKTLIGSALSMYSHIILAIHVPPFQEVCLCEKVSQVDDDWLPFMTCKAVGDVILGCMVRFPHKTLTVYCGHTHRKAIHKPLPNVTVYVGFAHESQIIEPAIIEI